MMTTAAKPAALLAGAGLVLVGLLWLTRRPAAPGTPAATQLGAAVAGGLIDGAAGAASGAVVAAGQVVGLPATNPDRCAAARLSGNAWDVSLYCPAAASVGYGAAALDGLFSGAVVGVGQAVGIPATNADKCAAAKAAGKGLDVSLYCTAGDFWRWLTRP
jgi:hypothetical protein